MYCYFYICFLCVLNCIWIVSDNVTPDPILACPAELFEVTTLGYSNLLVSWDPNKVNGSKITIQWHSNKGNSKSKFSRFSIYLGRHYKILWLKENTSYKIEIQTEYIWCWIEGKTTFKSNYSRLTKPDFNLQVRTAENHLYFPHIIDQPVIKIEWLPCGRKGYCKGEEVSGTHFSIKYKMLYSRQEWKTYEYQNNNTFLYGLLPGKPYEVIVTSISAGSVDLETDSDPQEVFIQPACSSVTSVKIITISNSSVLFSWKRPAQCGMKKWKDYQYYVILFSIFDSSPMVLLNYSYPESPYKEIKAASDRVDDFNSYFIQETVYSLTPGIRYTFFIIPVIEKGLFGLEHRIDYTLQTYQMNQPLAKPEFHYKLQTHCCILKVWWLPCGQEYDCKANRPGSYFSIKYRCINDGSGWSEKVKKKVAEVEIHLSSDKTYIVSVESRDEYNNSKSSEERTIYTFECYGQDWPC